MRQTGLYPVLTIRLVDLINKTGKSIPALAEEHRVNRTSLGDIIYGRRARLSVRDIELLSQILEVSSRVILEGTEYAHLLAEFVSTQQTSSAMLMEQIREIYRQSAWGGLIALAVRANQKLPQGYPEPITSQLLFSWMEGMEELKFGPAVLFALTQALEK